MITFFIGLSLFVIGLACIPLGLLGMPYIWIYPSLLIGGLVVLVKWAKK